MVYLLIFSLPVLFRYVLCANILITYDIPSPSYQIWNYALAKGLMEKGHNVTMLGPFADNGKSDNKYHAIKFEGVMEHILKHTEYTLGANLQTLKPLKMMQFILEYCVFLCEYSYNTNGYKQLLGYPKDFKFDLIAFDMTCGPCQFPLIQRFGYPPAIGITAFNLPWYISNIFGNDVNPSLDPYFLLQYTPNMNFFQRVINYVVTKLDQLNRNLYELRLYEILARKRFGESVDSLESLRRRITVMLSNINPVFHYPQILPPNIIPVGGLHVKPAEKLPQDLQTIMDNSKNGVVIFSLGSNVQSEKFTAKKKEAILDAFRKLKQTVIWKYNGSLENLPKNVILRPWIPQNDILGHPNTKLFIGHGGSLSTQEAIYHGVPLVGMPFYSDQNTQVNTLVERKLALRVDLTDLSAENFYACINEVLINPLYAKNMKMFSRRMRDELQTPLEKAVFWIEYVMRHDGAPFLNPKSRDMSIFASSCTDVQLFLLFITVALIYSLVFLSKKIILVLKYRKEVKEKLY